MSTTMFSEPTMLAERIDALDEDAIETTTVLIRLTVNMGTYADLSTIMQEVEQSLEWMAYDHDAILTGEWERTP